MQILDGTGSGKKAKVDSDQRLAVASVVKSRAAEISATKGQAFLIATALMNVTTSEGLMLYFLNEDSQKLFYISSAYLSFNGGSTTNNKSALARLYLGSVEPTANHTLYVPKNLNTASAVRASATSYVWNGTGTGMTTASNGVFVAGQHVSKGTNLIDFQGSIILNTAQSLGVTIQAEEAGTCFLVLMGYFE